MTTGMTKWSNFSPKFEKSSMNILMNSVKYGSKVMNVALENDGGSFFRPKLMTLYANAPHSVIKAVFSTSSSVKI